MGLLQVVWAASFKFISSHEVDILWQRDVGHFLLQQAEGRSNLQGLLPGYPKSRSERPGLGLEIEKYFFNHQSN